MSDTPGPGTPTPRSPLHFELSAPERMHVLRMAEALTNRAVQGGPAWIVVLYWLGIAGAMWIMSRLAAGLSPGYLQPLLIVGTGLGLLALWVGIARSRAVALGQARLGDFLVIDFDNDGLYVESSYGAASYGWYAVQRAEVSAPLVLIHLRGQLLLPVPLRVLSEASIDAERFVADINARARASSDNLAPSAAPSPPSPLPEGEGSNPPSPPGEPAADRSLLAQHGTPSQPWPAATHTDAPAEPPPLSYLHALWQNTVAGFALAFFSRNAAARLHASGMQVLGLLLIATLLGFAFDFARIGADGEFQPWGLGGVVQSLALVLTLATVVSMTLAAPRATARIAVALAALAIAFQFPGAVLQFAQHTRAREWAWPLYYAQWALWGWMAAAMVTGALRAAAAQGATATPQLRSAAAVAAVLLLLAMQWLLRYDDTLWAPRYDAAAESDNAYTQAMAAASEAALYAQPKLLDDALAAIAPGRPGVTDLFYIGFAGTGYQDVFLNEVTGAERVVHERFAAQGRGVLLANARRTPLERPFATATALERALGAVAAKMNKDEDVLLLFMTSHGSSKHEFQVELWPYRFDAITPERLRALLDASGITHRVLVISACYSGGFVVPLASPDTLIVTAAHAERTSFGCKDGEAWTYFGEAYFAHGLSSTGSFERAFELAIPRVAEREQREKREPSQPQISVGARIRERLQALEGNWVSGAPTGGKR